MTRICAWCGRPLAAAVGEPPPRPGRPSHGICASCAHGLRRPPAPAHEPPARAGAADDAGLDREEEEEE